MLKVASVARISFSPLLLESVVDGVYVAAPVSDFWRRKG
jgi:hypothetical protein